MHQSILKEIDGIATVLLNAPRNKEIGLYSGNAGVSLFLFYYARFRNSTIIRQKASEIVDDLFAQIEAASQPVFSLCTGIAGVGWLIDHLCQQGFLADDPCVILSDIDEYLYREAFNKLRIGYFDFLHGAMGIVFYLVKRNRQDYLHHLIRALSNIVVWDGDCAKWRAVSKHEEKILEFSISLSHGCSSLALVLGKILQIMPEEEMVKRLLKGTVEFICKQEISVEQYGCYFPAYSIESQQGDIPKSRLAWCHGDIGVALAIWQTGIRLRNQAWIDKGMDVLLFSANRRGATENRIEDAGICHGASGVAHIFNRLYRNTRDVAFKDAAAYWCREALSLGILGDGLTAYEAWSSKESKNVKLNKSFLSGIAGFGLSLLSFIMPKDPAWDDCLLLS